MGMHGCNKLCKLGDDIHYAQRDLYQFEGNELYNDFDGDIEDFRQDLIKRIKEQIANLIITANKLDKESL